MTAGQVQTFEASRTPQDTLDNMRTMDLLNGLKGIPPLDEIGISYSEDAAIYGQAFYDDTKDPKYFILIYKTAFEKGLPVVYSTLRHELIHIGQYYKQIKAANNEALDTDIVFDSTLDDRAIYKPAANAASEIETYAWEICNAGSTGVDKSYLYTRAIGLEQHWPQLKAPAVGSALFKSTINGWRNKVKGLRDAAIVSFEAVMDPVKWPTHNSAHTYDAELQRVAPAEDVEM